MPQSGQMRYRQRGLRGLLKVRVSFSAHLGRALFSRRMWTEIGFFFGLCKGGIKCPNAMQYGTARYNASKHTVARRYALYVLSAH